MKESPPASLTSFLRLRETKLDIPAVIFRTFLFNLFLKYALFSRSFSCSSSGRGRLRAAAAAAASCASVSLVVALEGVEVGLQAQGAGVGEVGGAVQVQARQDLHVSDSGRVERQQVLHPLRLVLGALQTHRQEVVVH